MTNRCNIQLLSLKLDIGVDECSNGECNNGNNVAIDPGVTWSDWVYTKKTSTGSWGVADPERLCSNYSTTGIECRTADGNKAASLNEHFECEKDIGFFCRNADQDEIGKTCGDYKFKLQCSKLEKRGEALLELISYRLIVFIVQNKRALAQA